MKEIFIKNFKIFGEGSAKRFTTDEEGNIEHICQTELINI